MILLLLLSQKSRRFRFFFCFRFQSSKVTRVQVHFHFELLSSKCCHFYKILTGSVSSFHFYILAGNFNSSNSRIF